MKRSLDNICPVFGIYIKFRTFSKKNMALIADLFPKLRTPKNEVTYMCQKPRSKGLFERQHGRRVKTLLPFEQQHRYHIY